MTSRHPSPETLAEYAAGSLKSGARLVLQLHLRACPECRIEVERMEQIGGALLVDAPEAALAPDALHRAFARLEAPAAAPAPRLTLEQILGRGLWIPLGTGLCVKPLSSFADPGEGLVLIRAAGGRALPEHGHSGPERLVVMRGAFQDDQGLYAAGDLSERGPEHRHQPVACPGEACLCLSATDGPLRLSGAARWLQPLLGL